MFGASSRHDKVFYKAFSDHAQQMKEAATLVQGWLSSGQDIERLRDRVCEIREAASIVLRDTICELRKTWITPFDAQDIRALLLSLDGVVELIKATAERAALFGLQNGDRRGAEDAARRLAEVVTQCCSALEQAFALLPHKRKEKDILRCCEEVQRLESQADVAYREGLAQLYDGDAARRAPNDGHDSMTHLMHVIKWRELYDTLEEAADRCRHVALQLEAVVEAHG